VIDGEAIIRGIDGYSDFNALYSGKHNDEVELIAFDVLALDGDDLRDLPLSMRKANLQRLLARRPDGISLSDFEQGEIVFRKACEFGLEGLVSKRADRPYRGGKSLHWIKVKNRHHHAFERVAIVKGCVARARVRREIHHPPRRPPPPAAAFRASFPALPPHRRQLRPARGRAARQLSPCGFDRCRPEAFADKHREPERQRGPGQKHDQRNRHHPLKMPDHDPRVRDETNT